MIVAHVGPCGCWCCCIWRRCRWGHVAASIAVVRALRRQATSVSTLVLAKACELQAVGLGKARRTSVKSRSRLTMQHRMVPACTVLQ